MFRLLKGGMPLCRALYELKCTSSQAGGTSDARARLFLSGFSEQTPPAARWRALAARKLKEVDALMDRAQRMKLLLETSFQCRCPRLEDCEKFCALQNASQHRRAWGERCYRLSLYRKYTPCGGAGVFRCG